MGVSDGTALDDAIRVKLDKCQSDVLKAIRPNYVYRIFDVCDVGDGIALNGTSLVLYGNAIREHLKNCNRAIVMAVTLSADADRCIRTAESMDMTDALITDSLCTAAIEQVCDIAVEEIKKNLSSQEVYMTWRFSPGYGDLPLDIQPHILRVINAEKQIGLTINDSLIMLPRKSVTAVIGLSERPIEQKRRGCETCNLSEVCNFRKRGVRCNDKIQ